MSENVESLWYVPPSYVPLYPCGMQADLSSTSLRDAAAKLGPSFVYWLTVHPTMQLEAQAVLRQCCADTLDNPLSPYINISVSKTYGPREWTLQIKGERPVGSKGVV